MIDIKFTTEKMGTAEPNLEKFFEEKKRVRNPFVPMGKQTPPFLVFISHLLKIEFSYIYLHLFFFLMSDLCLFLSIWDFSYIGLGYIRLHFS